MRNVIRTDFLVIGAGIAGASIGCRLAAHGQVIVLEREDQPGYHATGRSAALFAESYGPAQVRALTCASREFLQHPPAGFSEQPLLAPRGALVVATEEQRDLIDAHWQDVQSLRGAGRLSAAETRALVPVLRPDVIESVYDAAAADMDVNGLHHGYLRELRRLGGRLICQAEAVGIGRDAADWRVTAGGVDYQAPVIVNAAGAWADAIAQLAGVAPLGIEPRRRSAFLFAPPDGVDVARWPMMIGADETWYVKPDAGLLLGSPANADPTEPQDVQPEELDIALAVDRIEAMTTLTVRRPLRAWAGLRSFAPDGNLVGGFDDQAAGFFWCAGQGGYGIQTSAAMGEGCAALAMGRPLPARLADFGVTADSLSPRRLRRPARQCR